MSSWDDRPPEERALLNPGYCGILLWKASSEYAAEVGDDMPLDIAFLVLPLALHRAVRESLPRTVRTPLPVWLGEHPGSQARVSELVTTLVPFTREALLFGGSNKMLSVSSQGVGAIGLAAHQVRVALGDATEDMLASASRAAFVGKWLARSGSGATVMALFGLRP